MVDISVKKLVKAFEVDKNILDGLSFEIMRGERVGILGKNGVGKTTLFKILTGDLGYDEGDISIGTGVRMGLMSQIPDYPEEYTAEDVLMEAHKRQYELKEQLEVLSQKMISDSSQELMRQYDNTHIMFESMNGYNLEMERNKVTNGLQIPRQMREQQFSTLSGGEKTRVNLARLILEDTDILLLDEPTNHLDMRSTEWLEEYLQKFKGTVLIISHDRYFLDTVVTRTIEIRRGKAEFYSGNYSFYVDEKQRREEELQKKYDKEQSEIKRLTEAADRLYQWGTGNKKLMQKSFSIRSRIERMKRTERPDKDKKIHGYLETKAFRGDMVIQVKDLSKSYDGKRLFDNINLEVTGGERIAIIGDNGTGKSTFIKILIGQEKADTGTIKAGPSVKQAYLPQIVTFSNGSRSVLETLIYDQDLSPQSARNRLGAFKFQGEDVHTPVSQLSGGEKSRLRLCMLMKDSINLLILDEPTNHLDIDSREWMEEILEDYNEALIFISHDRYFISRFATRIWELDRGEIYDFYGSFEEYKRFKESQQHFVQIQKATEKKTKVKSKPKRQKSPAKLLEKLEREIEKLENERTQVIGKEAEYASDYEKLLELQGTHEELDKQLSELYSEWEELAEEIEE